jgi:hypothetical protein
MQNRVDQNNDKIDYHYWINYILNKETSTSSKLTTAFVKTQLILLEIAYIFLE